MHTICDKMDTIIWQLQYGKERCGIMKHVLIKNIWEIIAMKKLECFTDVNLSPKIIMEIYL